MGPGSRFAWPGRRWEEQRVTEPLLIEHSNGLDRVTLNRLEAAIAMEDRNQVLCSRSEEFGEGIRAFLEKRKPVYIRR
jgi:enoyl-CoA hydratase/carnithine racemase